MADSKAQFPSAALGVPCLSLMPCFLALDTALLIITGLSLSFLVIEFDEDVEGSTEDRFTGGGFVGCLKGDFFLLLLGISFLCCSGNIQSIEEARRNNKIYR